MLWIFVWDSIQSMIVGVLKKHLDGCGPDQKTCAACPAPRPCLECPACPISVPLHSIDFNAAMLRFPELKEHVLLELTHVSPKIKDACVRLEIEKLICLQSNRWRNFPQAQFAIWQRHHHTPICVRELIQHLGIAISYSAMHHGMAGASAYRDERLYQLIKQYISYPFTISFDNFQKIMASKVTSTRETSPFYAMTDAALAFLKVRAGSLNRVVNLVSMP